MQSNPTMIPRQINGNVSSASGGGGNSGSGRTSCPQRAAAHHSRHQMADEKSVGEGITNGFGEKVRNRNNCVGGDGHSSTNANDDPEPSAVIAAARQAPTATTIQQTEGGAKAPSSAIPPQGEGRKQAQQKPQVPPKPSQLDIYRYSMSNAKDEMDLDNLLAELLELETQLGAEADGAPFGLPPTLSSSHPITKVSTPSGPNNDELHQSGVHALSHPSGHHHQLPQPQKASVSPDVDSAFGECSSSGSNGSGILGISSRNGAVMRATTTAYSACTDQRSSQLSSTDSQRESLNTLSPIAMNRQTFAQNAANVDNDRSPTSAATTNIQSTSSLNSSTNSLIPADLRAQKIRAALEKMKEAKIKRIYVKVFLSDQGTKGVLIDERWSVLETMRHLAEKLGMVLTPEHCIVEEQPNLHIRRVYEDHEFVVENIEDWLDDSKNKLCFVRCPEKYAFVGSPQHYLVAEKSYERCLSDQPPPAALPPTHSAANRSEWSAEAKNILLNAYVESENNRVPELEDWLWLKSDGKKAWKKHYFTLRASGLYYHPKSGKTVRGTKDLQCLINAYNNQVYTCMDWRKKYKAPSNFGFAIKHPKVQVKTSKYIKYVCCESEGSYRKWVTALRIMRNGFHTLYGSYTQLAVSRSPVSHSPSPPSPIKVDVPQVVMRSTPAKAPSANFTSSPTVAMAANRTNGSHPLVGEALQCSSPELLHASFGRPVALRLAAGDETLAGSGIMFDQDECGTIKRQPYQHHSPYSHSSNRTTSGPSTPSSSNSSHLPMMNGSLRPVSGVNGNGNSYVVEEDSDSDEEQLPPPPPLGSATLVSNVPQSPMGAVPDSPRLRLFNNFSTSHIKSPANGHLQSASAALKKVPPPPPPKRSDATRLQTPSWMGVSAPDSDRLSLSTDLYSELQVVTARQREKLEQSLNGGCT